MNLPPPPHPPGRFLNTVNPCRGCGLTDARYDNEAVLHDETACMIANEVRFFLGIPLGTRVLFQLAHHAHPMVGIVRRSAQVPWTKYRVDTSSVHLASPVQPTNTWHVPPDQILDTLPQDLSDSEAVQRWLASG